MNDQKALEELLKRIDGKGYGAYKDLKGSYQFPKYKLIIDHVQGDPFAAPSRVRIVMEEKVHGLPKEWLSHPNQRVAVADFLTRTFRMQIFKQYEGVGGSGKSGLLSIDDCGQQMIERSAVMIERGSLAVSFEVGLPAAGRRVLGKSAIEIFCKALPKIAEKALIYKNIDSLALKKQIELYLDQQFMREQLRERGLIAFVANGAILPRESGISQRPLSKGAIPFSSPSHLEVTLKLPYGGVISGMGIPKGITLIVGGGYHGKSTLLNALELGVYNHIAGDGREYVIMDQDAMKVRAEDGRSVAKVDISSFIDHLPNQKDTVKFETQNASGSTSQAANTMEALEAGASCLLIDEDTSATNFMIRDSRMQKLVKKEKEPITPFIDRVRQLYEQYDVSTILVVGGSGDYFEVADRIIMMDEYVPKEVTEEAKAIAAAYKNKRIPEVGYFKANLRRVPLKTGFKQSDRESRVKVRGKECISIGKSDITLDFVEQLIDPYQTKGIAVILAYLMTKEMNGHQTLDEMIDNLYEKIKQQGLQTILGQGQGVGNIALPRKQEVYAALNRYRMLKIE